MTIILKKRYVINKIILFVVLYKIYNFKFYNSYLYILAKKVSLIIKNSLVKLSYRIKKYFNRSKVDKIEVANKNK